MTDASTRPKQSVKAISCTEQEREREQDLLETTNPRIQVLDVKVVSHVYERATDVVQRSVPSQQFTSQVIHITDSQAIDNDRREPRRNEVEGTNEEGRFA